MRSYVNRLARFSSPDPLAGSLSIPQSLNRYGYSLADPLNLLDPSGLDPCDGDTAIGGCVSVTAGGGSGPYDTGGSDPGNITQNGQVFARKGGGAASRIACAIQFGRNHSLAAGVGAIFGDKVGNNFVTQLFLGNSVSRLAKIGTDVFGNTAPTAPQVASMALKGAGQGLPIPNAGPGVRGLVGPARNAAVGTAVSAGYNVIAGVGQETLELGISASGNVATAVAPLASTTLQAVASGVAIGKFAFDGSVFVIGLIRGCHE